MRDRQTWRDVERYCMFIGHGRSGHSLVGALLDAHPNIVIPHERDALGLLEAGFSRGQIFHLLADKAARDAARGRTSWGYSYAVPNQSQGSFTTLRVIGDKQGAVSTRRLGKDPNLLGVLRTVVGVPITFVHVVRNPYDNIATLFLRRQQRQPDVTMEESIDGYFLACQRIELIDAAAPGDVVRIRHEDFVDHPASSLGELCRVLGVEPSDEYLDACASIVFPSPRTTRGDAPWTDDLLARVASSIDEHRFLRGYSFSDGGG
jgi:hypothetical protein